MADPELVTGAFVFLNHGDDEIHYFVNRHSDNGAHSGVSVNGLSGDRYNMQVFSLNGTGLPFTFPANQSEVTSVAAAGTCKCFRRLIPLGLYDAIIISHS